MEMIENSILLFGFSIIILSNLAVCVYAEHAQLLVTFFLFSSSITELVFSNDTV